MSSASKISMIVKVSLHKTKSAVFNFTNHNIAIFRCTGRFDVYFNPLGQESVDVGGQGTKGERYCSYISRKVEESFTETIDLYLSFSWLISCKTTIYLTRVIMFGLPEMILYFTTFWHIKRRNQKTALSGIISEDTVRKRKQQNKLNIMVTFWAWMAQLVTNVIYFMLMNIFFGRSRFYHSLLANVTICLNFNILPFFYIIMADDDLKTAIQSKRMTAIFNFLRGVSNE